MTFYPHHPISMLMPDPDSASYQSIVDSMRKHGFDPNKPIWLFEGAVLDGRNRQDAARDVGIEPIYREFTGTFEEAVELGERENLARRHLTTGQRAMYAVKKANLVNGHNQHTNRTRTEPSREGVSFETPSKSAIASIPPPPAFPPVPVPVTAENAAIKYGVSRASVFRAAEVEAIDPKLAQAVKNGEVTLGTAHKKAKAAAAKKAGPPPPPPPPTDAAGRKIHPKAAYALGDGRSKFIAIIAALRQLKKDMLALQETELGRELHRQTIELESENLIRQFTSAIPYTSCPLNATCDEKCQLCRGTQWIGKLQWGGVPREFK